MNFFESPHTPEENSGGPSAYRAVWLQEKMKGNHPESRGLPIVADSSVARSIRLHHPDAFVVDSELDSLSGLTYESLAEKNPELSWVIVARDGGENPLVHVQNLQTGEFLPNDQSVYLEKSWEGGHNAFVDKIHRAQQTIKESTQGAEE